MIVVFFAIAITCCMLIDIFGDFICEVTKKKKDGEKELVILNTGEVKSNGKICCPCEHTFI